MKLEVFDKIVTLLKHQENKSTDLLKLGIDTFNYEESYISVITLLLRAYYGKDGEDMISWFLYERESHTGEILQAWDKDGSEICYDIPSLWKYVEELRCSEDFVEYELPEPVKFDETVFTSLMKGFLNSNKRNNNE